MPEKLGEQPNNFLKNLEEKQKKIREEVKKFKEEHQGLLPEMFALPGEGKEEEKEYAEETILAYQLKEFLEEIRPGMENKQLIENAREALKSDIESGKQIGKALESKSAVDDYISFKQSGLWSELDLELQEWVKENIKDSRLIGNLKEWLKFAIEYGKKLDTLGAQNAVWSYALFKQSGLWSELDLELQEWVKENIKDSRLIENAKKKLKSNIESYKKSDKDRDAPWNVVSNYISFKQSGLWSELDLEFQWIEENIKDPQLIKDAKEDLKSDIKSGKWLDKTWRARDAVRKYTLFSQFQQILEKQGDKKNRAKEQEKAIHPEKKIPPRPEARTF